jgi:hypothetical protein
MFNRRSKLMKQFRILALGWISALAIAASDVAGQTNVPVAQNNARGATNGSPRASNARPNGPVSHNVGRGISRQTQMAGQRAVNLRPNYSPSARPLNPTLTAMRARESARTYNVQPVAGMLAKNDVAQSTLPMTNTQRIPRPYNLQRTTNIPARHDVTQSDPVTPDVQADGKILKPTFDERAPRETVQDKPRHNRHAKKHRVSYSDALRSHRHEWHDRDWWRQHCKTIVFVTGGYYFLDAGYWYPAWGYDPLNSYYDYDGPIYTYGNLLPDEVIANVQVALQEAGYYFGAITGSLSVETRAALANYQRDYGLIITGAIDEPTVESLGLY